MWVLPLLYGAISVVAVAGNALVMWIVATSGRMQDQMYCYIANLALADILIALFAIPFQLLTALLERWSLPDWMCPLYSFMQVLSVNVSSLTLTAIAIERHRAIHNPSSEPPSRLRGTLQLLAIWGSGAVTAAPMAVSSTVTQVKHLDLAGRVVTKPFCVNQGLSDGEMQIYRLLLVLLQYVISLSVISFVYARVAHTLQGSRVPRVATLHRNDIIRKREKVTKMLEIVVAVFAVCWLPLQTYNVLLGIFPQINEYRFVNIIWFCCHLLATSNSCYNPFIYGIYNEHFKKEFKRRNPCARCRKRSPGDGDVLRLNSLEGGSQRPARKWTRQLRHQHLPLPDTALRVTSTQETSL